MGLIMGAENRVDPLVNVGRKSALGGKDKVS